MIILSWMLVFDVNVSSAFMYASTASHPHSFSNPHKELLWFLSIRVCGTMDADYFF